MEVQVMDFKRPINIIIAFHLQGWYDWARLAAKIRVSQLKRNTFQWFIVLRLEGKYLCIKLWYGVVE